MRIESHFGLRRRPFPALPDWSCYYPSTSHERAVQRLQDGVCDGEGVLLLTAGPGLGKTLLGHCLLERLGDDVQACLLTHTHFRDRAGLLQALLHDLGLPCESRPEQDLRLALIDHLLTRFRAGKRTLLVLDEAQHLGIDLLEELRLLGNLEGQAGRAVQILLLAQPELLQTLGWPDLASLKQRLAVRATLEPLGLEEAADYLLHHLRHAGGRAERILGLEALEVLARGTGGVPRLLNQAGQLSLRLAMEASTAEVDVEVALEALAQLGLGDASLVEQPVLADDGVEGISPPNPRQVLPLPGEEAEAMEADHSQTSGESCRLFMASGRTA